MADSTVAEALRLLNEILALVNGIRSDVASLRQEVQQHQAMLKDPPPPAGEKEP